MAEAASAADAPKVSRLDRRKARTRQALIDAAVRLIAEGRGDRASIAEITEEADIGFGSFYNHFDSKEQLFATASEEVLERWGQLIDRASAGISRPGGAVRRGHADLRAARLDPPRHRRVPRRHPAWMPWTSPAAWRRVRCATSRPGRPRAGSPSPMPRSRSAPWPAACSGCCGCASGTRTASRRPPSTSSPRPSCACSASPPTKPPASPPSPSRTPARGNSRHDAADRVPSATPGSPRGAQARGIPGAETYLGLHPT